MKSMSCVELSSCPALFLRTVLCRQGERGAQGAVAENRSRTIPALGATGNVPLGKLDPKPSYYYYYYYYHHHYYILLYVYIVCVYVYIYIHTTTATTTSCCCCCCCCSCSCSCCCYCFRQCKYRHDFYVYQHEEPQVGSLTPQGCVSESSAGTSQFWASLLAANISGVCCT